MNDIIKQIIEKSHHLSWMDKGCIYLTLHGSKAFGTNVSTSDDDYKGICIPPKYIQYSFHKSGFEQAELSKPDVVIYEIKKFFKLASMANPSIIETLFTAPEDQIFVSTSGQELLNNKEKFISKRVRATFSGYSISQLKRIILHKKYFTNPPKAPPTRKEYNLPEHTLIPADQLAAAEAAVRKDLEKYNFDFMEELSEPIKINIKNIMSEMLSEAKLSSEQLWLGSARKIGLSDNFIELMQKERAYKNIQTEWLNYINWKKTRNPERAALEERYGLDCKNAYHLVRLMRMCREILTTGKVIVKRPDREELLSIRNGAWSYEKIIEFAEREDKELQIIYENCNILPKVPDMNFLDNLCIRLIEKNL